MAPNEDLVAQFLTFIEDGDLDAARAWAADIQPSLVEDVPAELSASLRVPTPHPAALAAHALTEFDRGFRWALRGIELNAPPETLRARQRRPVAVTRGLTVQEVRPGSWVLDLLTDPALRAALDADGLRVVVEIIAGLRTVGWAVTKARAVFRKAGTPESDSRPAEKERPTAEIHIHGPIHIYFDCEFTEEREEGE